MCRLEIVERKNLVSSFFVFDFDQLFFEGVHRVVGSLLEGLGSLGSHRVVATDLDADVGGLVLRLVGVLELQRHFGADDAVVHLAEFLNLFGDEGFQVFGQP